MPTRHQGRTVTLRDGARVRLRPIAPEDRQLLATSFERLSEQSRYRRFMTTKSTLSAAELTYLVDEVDHSDHEAIVAIDPVTGLLLGIARYVRSEEHSETAEVAVTVADDWQRRGLGRALLDRLTYRARGEGVRRFSALVLSENRPALGLFADLGSAEHRRSAGEVEMTIELPPVRGMGAQLVRALRAAGSGTLVPARTLAQRTAGGGRTAGAGDLGRPVRRIVLGLSEHWAEEPTFAVAAELAGTLGASLHIVQAYSGEQRRTATEAALAEARAAAIPAKVQTFVHPRRDEPADALLAAAAELDAELVVLGGFGLAPAPHLFAGSIANRVSHRARCSVLIVRRSARAED